MSFTQPDHENTLSEFVAMLGDLHPGELSESWSETEKADYINVVARRNVSHSVELILQQSRTINRLVQEGRLAVVGAMYDVVTGRIDFFPDDAADSPAAPDG